MARKTWVQKRDIDKIPEVKKVDMDFADIKAGQKMLVATPRIVDGYIRHIPKGHEASLTQMRKDLAAEYHAEATCPVTSGIFLRIVAEAAYEEYMNGKPVSKIAPFWRMINEKSPTAKKLSFGTDFLMAQRRKEKLP
jgi:hypothetical protein